MKTTYCSAAWINRCCNTECESYISKKTKPQHKSVIILSKETKDCGFVDCKEQRDSGVSIPQ